MPKPMYLTPNTVLADRYRISRLLGQGGMGAVYLAADLRFRNAPVAVKQTLVGSHRDDLRKAFEREAMLLNHLRHPALPRVTDFFVQEDSEFLVMEYVPGDDLSSELDRLGTPFPIEKVAHWADQLLDALCYLHSQSPPVIHRDIKPQNVRLTPQGAVVQLDIGLSKGSIGEQLTAGSSVVAGTPNYASPEQLGGQGTDERADLFSFAATIYCLLTAAPPPDASRRLMCLVNGQDDPLQLAHILNPAVPPSLSFVLKRALKLRRDDRPVSAAEMRQQIRSSLGELALNHPELLPHDTHKSDSFNFDAPAGANRPLTLFECDGLVQEPTLVERLMEAHPPTIVSSTHSTTRGAAGGTSRPKPGISRSVALAIAGVSLAAIASVALGLLTNWPASSKQVEPITVQTLPIPPSVVPLQPSTVGRAGNAVADLGNGVRIELVVVPAGGFDMGSRTGESDERPVHRVMLPNPFLLGKYEVTQDQWKAVMGENPSNAKGSSLPVEKVSWDDVQKFLTTLNARTGGGWRLPTEAEWEYACRAGTTGDSAGDLDEMAWIYTNAAFKSQKVGLKRPNRWGLFDMHGNVSEWCQDWYDRDYYDLNPGTSVACANEGTGRVIRGGSYVGTANDCRSENRDARGPLGRNIDIGFRLARDQ